MAVLLILLLQRWSGVRQTLVTIINSSNGTCFVLFFIGDIERRCPCKMAVTISSACAILNERVLLVVFGISASQNVDKGFPRLCC